jgi:hypothetical protein
MPTASLRDLPHYSPSLHRIRAHDGDAVGSVVTAAAEVNGDRPVLVGDGSHAVEVVDVAVVKGR